MNVTLIGAGGIGQTLGGAWDAAGHRVRFGVRDPARYPDLPEAATVAEAVSDASVVVLAVPGKALPELLAEHASVLDGLLVIDATNSVEAVALHQLPLLTSALPSARIARAFCSVGREVMAEPVIDGSVADLFWCGPDGPDGAVVSQFIADVGLRPIRIGGLDSVAVLDGVTRLWFALAFAQGYGRHHALRVLGAP